MCRGLTAALPHVQLAPGSARALSHSWVQLWSGGKEDDPCAWIPTWACTCQSGDASRALPGAWLCVKSRGGQGLSSSFPARLGLVTCTGGQILLWIPPSQRCRRSGESREADPSGVLSHVQPSFISYQHCLGKAAMKQRPRTGVEAVRCSCHVFQPLTVAPGAGEGWQGSFLRSHLRTRGGTWLSPSQMMGRQGT